MSSYLTTLHKGSIKYYWPLFCAIAYNALNQNIGIDAYTLFNLKNNPQVRFEQTQCHSMRCDFEVRLGGERLPPARRKCSTHL